MSGQHAFTKDEYIMQYLHLENFGNSSFEVDSLKGCLRDKLNSVKSSCIQTQETHEKD